MTDTKPSAQREEGPDRDALVRRGIVPRAEFKPCDGCGMPSSCRAARRCCRGDATKDDSHVGMSSARQGLLSGTVSRPTGEWPFHRLAAARRTEIEKIDADVTAWRHHADHLVQQVRSGATELLDQLVQHLDSVVAVRA